MDLRSLVKIKKTRILLRWKYRKEFKLFKEAITIGRKLITTKTFWDENSNFKKVLLFILVKNFQTAQAIETLCKKGFGQDAMPLVRVMTENLIEIYYMKLDKEKKAKAYLDYDNYNVLKDINELLSINSAGIDKEKLYKRKKELEIEWNKVKGNYRTPNGNTCNHWSCKGLKQMAKEAGMLFIYSFLYRLASDFAHGSRRIARDYILGRDGKGIVIELGASESLIDKIVPTAAVYLLSIVKISDEEYNGGFQDRIDILRDKLDSHFRHLNSKDIF